MRLKDFRIRGNKRILDSYISIPREGFSKIENLPHYFAIVTEIFWASIFQATVTFYMYNFKCLTVRVN